MSAARDQLVNEALAQLCAKFPKSFFLYQYRRRPLKIGIHLDIEAALGDAIERPLLRRALRFYFVNFGYQGSLRTGAARLDLDGNACGAVTEQEAAWAKRSIAGIKAARTRPKKKPPPSAMAYRPSGRRPGGGGRWHLREVGHDQRPPDRT